MKRIFLALLALAFFGPAHAVIIHESAALGPTGNYGGYSLTDQFLGSRFTLTESQTVTAIGGHINIFTGSIWGAIVTLPSAGAYPAFDPADIEANALASALFEDTGASADYREAVDVTLAPGNYALLFGGGGFFGSTGYGAMPTNNPDLAGASFFRRDNNTNTWQPTGTGLRFVVEGIPLPEPATLALMAIGLAGIGFARRKKA